MKSSSSFSHVRQWHHHIMPTPKTPSKEDGGKQLYVKWTLTMAVANAIAQENIPFGWWGVLLTAKEKCFHFFSEKKIKKTKLSWNCTAKCAELHLRVLTWIMFLKPHLFSFQGSEEKTQAPFISSSSSSGSSTSLNGVKPEQNYGSGYKQNVCRSAVKNCKKCKELRQIELFWSLLYGWDKRRYLKCAFRHSGNITIIAYKWRVVLMKKM